MTTYTAIPDSDIDPESPGTTTLFTRLRDNPLAIAEGDASAPDIAYSALAPATVDGGTTYKLTTPVDAEIQSLSYVLAVEWQVSLSGTINVYFGLQGAYYLGSYLTAYARIYKNGSPVGTERSTTTDLVYYSENISVSNGDLVQIYVKKSSFLSAVAYLYDAQLRDTNAIPGSIVRSYPNYDTGGAS